MKAKQKEQFHHSQNPQQFFINWHKRECLTLRTIKIYKQNLKIKGKFYSCTTRQIHQYNKLLAVVLKLIIFLSLCNYLHVSKQANHKLKLQLNFWVLRTYVVLKLLWNVGCNLNSTVVTIHQHLCYLGSPFWAVSLILPIMHNSVTIVKHWSQAAIWYPTIFH